MKRGAEAGLDSPNKRQKILTIFEAAEIGDVDTIKYLSKNGVDVNQANCEGLTPLIIAARKGYSNAIEALVEAGAQVDKPYNNGSTPIMFSAQEGHVEATKTLISSGAKVDEVNNYGSNALMFAAVSNSVEIIRVLVGVGVSINFRNKCGNTSLLLAAKKNHVEAIRVLIELGAEIDATNHKGETARMWADWEGSSDAIEVLAELGAKWVTKTLQELIHQEVNNGDYADFRWSLIQEDITKLDLSYGKVANINLMHLGEALQGTQVKLLDVGFNDISDTDGAKLCKALKGTQVTTLILAGNHLSPDGMANAVQELRGTQVRTLDLHKHRISSDGLAKLGEALQFTQINSLELWNYSLTYDDIKNVSARLAPFVPNTLLIDVCLWQRYDSLSPDPNFVQSRLLLDDALKKNRWEKQLTPFYLASLEHLPQNEKIKYYSSTQLENDVPSESSFYGICRTVFGKINNFFRSSSKPSEVLSNSEDDLKYAGGIFIKLGQYGLPELQHMILSFMPGVTPALAFQYQSATAKAVQKKEAQMMCARAIFLKLGECGLQNVQEIILSNFPPVNNRTLAYQYQSNIAKQNEVQTSANDDENTIAYPTSSTNNRIS